MHVLSTAVKTFIVVAVGTVAGTARHVAGQCGTPDSSLGARIDASYIPASTGAWAEMRNWGDVVTDGSMGDGGVGKYEGGSRDQLAFPIGGGDWYAFALRSGTQNPFLDPEMPAQHQPIMLADPSVLRIAWQGETWYFITGTSGAPDRRTRLTGVINNDSNQDELAILGTQLANFIIYRTKDFYHFEPHMLVFREYTPGNPNGSRRTNTVLHIGNRSFIALQSPHLYIDPEVPDYVYLTFTGVEYRSGETAPDWATNRTAWETDLFNNSSVFMTRISLADFMSWKCQNWYTYQGPRFDYGPHWYYYQYPNGSGTPRHDGGYSVGRYIPCSGPPQEYDGRSVITSGEDPGVIVNGELEPRLTTDQERMDPPYAGRGWGHAGWASHTWMAEGGYVFIDSKQGAVPNRWMLYDWNDAWKASGNPPGDTNPTTTNAGWGNAICAHPLLPNQQYFDSDYNALFLANNRSDYNPVSPCPTYCVKNGRANDNGLNWWWGGVAESSCAFYLESTDCYYFLFSRNGHSTAAYQIVYRRTLPGQPFTALNIASATDFTKPESVLLRGLHYSWYRDPVPPPPPATPPQPPASYGSPTYFEMVDAEGIGVPYIAFHARFEASPRRTIFFKELTLSGNDLLQLREQRDGTPTRQESISYYRIPWCRPPGCVADINQDGIVDFVDYIEFLNLYEAGDLTADLDRDCQVAFSDYLEFLNHYNAGC